MTKIVGHCLLPSNNLFENKIKQIQSIEPIYIRNRTVPLTWEITLQSKVYSKLFYTYFGNDFISVILII